METCEYLPRPLLFQSGKYLLTQAQSEEIIGVGILGEVPVEGFLEGVILFSQTGPQCVGGCLIGPLRRLKLRKLVAEGIDLIGDLGIVEEQSTENIIHRKQLL